MKLLIIFTKLRLASLFLLINFTQIIATNSNLNIEKTLGILEEERVHFVLLTFSDMIGNIKEVTIPVQHAKNALKYGISFDSSSIMGHNDITESDMVLKPDLSTLRFLPWTQDLQKTAWFICDVYKNETEPFEADPRYILKKQTQELQKLGYVCNIGPELEFFLFKRNKNNGPSTEPIDQKKYFDPELSFMRQQENKIIIQALRSLSIDVEKLHHEVASGQHEVSLKYSDALNIADQIVVAKYALKVLTEQLNMFVTFMPKPLNNLNGSGMHMHISLFNTVMSKNIFYDNHEKYNLSKTAQSFIGGILKNINEFGALLNPTVNSYKRLIPGFEAPVYICWGNKNRSALIRVPLIHDNAQASMRAEIRCPDGSSNPYLACASLIAAGLQGIKENSKLPDPVTDNLYKLNKETLAQRFISSLSANLNEALNNLESSKLAAQILSPKGLETFIRIKRKEWLEYSKTVSNWELNQYL